MQECSLQATDKQGKSLTYIAVIITEYQYHGQSYKCPL